MNPRLTPAQIDDIFAGAEYVDVSGEQLVAAAAEIRATLLAASDDAAWLLTLPAVDDAAPVRRIDPLRRARTVRVALVAAALALALVLSAAIAGALPDPIRGPITSVAEFFGLDVPAADSANSPASDPATGATRDRSGGAPSGPTGTAASPTTATPVSIATAPDAPTTPDKPGNGGGYGYGIENGNGPPENPGNGNGPPEHPGNGNGPPDNPGNGNGPPAPPGTGNGNNPDGPGA